MRYTMLHKEAINMRYLIDSADPRAVQEILEYYPAEGVTTNPTIVARARCEFGPMLKAMRQALGDKMLHAQTLQTTADEMVREALALREFAGEPFFVKLPANPEGLKACMSLKKLGVGVTMTAIVTPQQALVAARAGADFVAPYVNKLDDVGDGVGCVEKIVQLMREFDLKTKVLSASFRNVEQVTAVALAGSDYITLPPAFYEKLIWHPMTDLAIRGFESDWHDAYGGKLPIDLL